MKQIKIKIGCLYRNDFVSIPSAASLFKGQLQITITFEAKFHYEVENYKCR